MRTPYLVAALVVAALTPAAPAGASNLSPYGGGLGGNVYQSHWGQLTVGVALEYSLKSGENYAAWAICSASLVSIAQPPMAIACRLDYEGGSSQTPRYGTAVVSHADNYVQTPRPLRVCAIVTMSGYTSPTTCTNLHFGALP